MRKIIDLSSVAITFMFSSCLLVLNYSVSAQFNLGDEMKNMLRIPQSPEAAAFATYGDHQVSLYSGTPNISIPIHVHQGLESSLPIILNYDATGVKVESMASQVGLNWSMMGAGMITRVVKGLPDTNIACSPAYLSPMYDSELHSEMLEYLNDHTNFDTPSDAVDFLDFKLGVGEGYNEMNWDLYKVSTPFGLSTTIVFDVNTLEPVSLNDPNIKIEVTLDGLLLGMPITGWVITEANGAKSYFELSEVTHVLSDPETNFYNLNSINYGASREYCSGWYLTRYESPNRLDIYEFNYEDQPEWQQAYPASPVEAATFTIPDPYPSSNSYGLANLTSTAVDYHITEKTLTEITHNNKTVISIDTKGRADHYLDDAIDRINIHNTENPSIYKYYELDHSYFGDANSPSRLDKRLKLDKVTCVTKTGDPCESFQMEYISPGEVPSRSSLSQDYMGYYNGKSNQTLIPHTSYGEDTYAGGDRTPNFDYSAKGMLYRMTYATGGYTEFEWEPHTSPVNSDDVDSSLDQVKINDGAVLALGGQDPTTVCNNACHDIYDQYSSPPVVESIVINLENHGYQMEYAFSGDPMDQFGSNAYLFYLGPYGDCYEFDDVTLCEGGGAELPFEELIDNQGLMLETLVWSSSEGNGPTGSLDAGAYQLVVVNGVANTTTVASIHHYEWQMVSSGGVVGEGSAERAGIRIGKISNYTEEGNVATTKEFRYTTTIDGLTSSGSILHQPVLEYHKIMRVLKEDPENEGHVDFFNELAVVRTSYGVGAGRPHIGYERVYEVLTDGNGGTPLGYTENNLNTGYTGSISLYTPYTVDYYVVDPAAGKPASIRAFNSESEVLTESRTEYSGGAYFLNEGVTMTKNEASSFKFPVIVPNNGGMSGYHIEYHDASLESISWSGLGAVEFPGTSHFYGYEVHGPMSAFASQETIQGMILPNQPSICDQPQNTCYANTDVSTWGFAVPTAEGEVELVSRTESYQIFDSDTVFSFSENSYEESLNYLLRESKTVNSAGDTLKARFYYPEDLEVGGSDLLIQKNTLAQVVKTESYFNNELLSTRTTDFQQTEPSVVVPDTIKISKGEQALEIMATMEYHSDGRVRESSRPSGTSTVYLWGYDSTRVIAKLEGISYQEVDPLDISTLESLADSDVDGTSEQTLRTALSNIVQLYPDAMIVGYTYSNGLVTSIMDPSGTWSKYYEYDGNGRLKAVRDQYLNLIEEYDYQLAGQ